MASAVHPSEEAKEAWKEDKSKQVERDADGKVPVDQFAAQFKSESERAIDAANAERAELGAPRVTKMGLTIDPRDEADSEHKEADATAMNTRAMLAAGLGGVQ